MPYGITPGRGDIPDIYRPSAPCLQQLIDTFFQ